MEKQRGDVQLASLLNSLKNPISSEELKTRFKQSINVGFATQANPYVVSEYGQLNSPEAAPKNSVAIVNFTDTITKYDQFCSAGAITKANILQRTDANPNVKGTILISDGPGGEGSAARLLNDTINKMKKPVIGLIDDLAASAHYYFMSACDKLFVNNNQALVGSIGTYITIADYPAYYEELGLKTLEVYADDSTDKNRDYWDAIEYMRSDGKKGSLAGIKKLVNTFNNQFLADVKSNRGHALKGKDSEWNTGKLLFTDKAEEIGLIDGVDSLENIIDKFY